MASAAALSKAAILLAHGAMRFVPVVVELAFGLEFLAALCTFKLFAEQGEPHVYTMLYDPDDIYEIWQTRYAINQLAMIKHVILRLYLTDHRICVWWHSLIQMARKQG